MNQHSPTSIHAGESVHVSRWGVSAVLLHLLGVGSIPADHAETLLGRGTTPGPPVPLPRSVSIAHRTDAAPSFRHISIDAYGEDESSPYESMEMSTYGDHDLPPDLIHHVHHTEELLHDPPDPPHHDPPDPPHHVHTEEPILFLQERDESSSGAHSSRPPDGSTDDRRASTGTSSNPSSRSGQRLHGDSVLSVGTASNPPRLHGDPRPLSVEEPAPRLGSSWSVSRNRIWGEQDLPLPNSAAPSISASTEALDPTTASVDGDVVAPNPSHSLDEAPAAPVLLQDDNYVAPVHGLERRANPPPWTEDDPPSARRDDHGEQTEDHLPSSEERDIPSERGRVSANDIPPERERGRLDSVSSHGENDLLPHARTRTRAGGRARPARTTIRPRHGETDHSTAPVTRTNNGAGGWPVGTTPVTRTNDHLRHQHSETDDFRHASSEQREGPPDERGREVLAPVRGASQRGLLSAGDNDLLPHAKTRSRLSRTEQTQPYTWSTSSMRRSRHDEKKRTVSSVAGSPKMIPPKDPATEEINWDLMIPGDPATEENWELTFTLDDLDGDGASPVGQGAGDDLDGDGASPVGQGAGAASSSELGSSSRARGRVGWIFCGYVV